MQSAAYFKDIIRDIPDFPKKGIIFKDITTVLKDAEAFKRLAEELSDKFKGQNISKVVCVEARGFILGALCAYLLGCGLVLVRKKGKLPYETTQIEYDLEYGKDVLEIHKDAVEPGEKVIIVDDLLATGGTTEAAAKLLKGIGADIMGLGFFIELSFLKGRERLSSYQIHAVLTY